MTTRFRSSPDPGPSGSTRGDSDQHKPMPVGPVGIAAPQRSFLADFLALGALGFMMFGVLFSWLAARSRAFETFSDIFWDTGIWAGLIFGVILGGMFGWLLRPRTSSYRIDSPDQFRARLTAVLPKMRLAIHQEAGNEILLHPTKRPPLPILKEETVHLSLAANQVTITGGAGLVGRLRRKLRLKKGL